MKHLKKIVPLVVAIILLGALFEWWKDRTFSPYPDNPMQYMPDMHRTPALIPLRGSRFFKDRSNARVPPQGTLSRNGTIYPYTKVLPAEKVRAAKNPILATEITLLKGQETYGVYCQICHGQVGLGDGKIVPPFTKPPSLHSKRLRGLADSQLFHIITVGQNVMPGYSAQIQKEDRWAVIHYVRALQRAMHPKAKDLAAYKASR